MVIFMMRSIKDYLSHPVNIFQLIFAVTMFTGISLTVFSAGYPKAIQTVVAQGMKVEKTFPVVSGMTGWLISINGKYTIVYTSKDSKTLIAGALYDEQGKDLTAQYKKKYIPAPDFSGIYQELKDSTYIVEGKKKNPKSMIYVFFDPNCPYCHKAWIALQAYEQAGLQARWIPVAYLRPSSESKVIKMLEARDQTAAFRNGMKNFVRDRNAPADIALKDRPKIADLISKNSQLMAKFGLNATPAFVWKQKDGNIAVMKGLPPPQDFPRITGMSLKKD